MNIVQFEPKPAVSEDKIEAIIKGLESMIEDVKTGKVKSLYALYIHDEVRKHVILADGPFLAEVSCAAQVQFQKRYK